MRNLKRNQQKIYIANLTENITDEWGNPAKDYGAPEPYMISISPNTGETIYNGFGTELDYDRTMVTTDLDCPINEYTRLWIDADPETEPYNFEVKRKAPNLNQVLYAIKKVEVSFEND